MSESLPTLKVTAVFLFVALLVLAATVYFGQRRFFYPAPQQVPVAPPPGYRFIETSTSDGLKLRAAYRPAATGRPTLLFFHGNGDSLTGADAATRRLTEQGFGALLVEYRGYGGNPGSPSEEGLYRDGEAAMAWLRDHGIGPNDVVIVGNSIGSGPATEMALRHKPAALVLVSGFASLPTAVADLLPLGPPNWMVRDHFDNQSKIGRVKSPILILHGNADTLVLPKNAQLLAQAAPRAHVVIMPGRGHELAYLSETQAAMLAWLENLDT